MTSAGATSPAHGVSAASGSSLVQMKNSLQNIWKDYSIRTDMVRSIGRSLSLVGN